MIYGYEDGYTEPSADQEMHWAIHHDHAGNADHEDGLEADELDPEQRRQIALKIAQLNDDYRKNSIPAQWGLTPEVEEAKLTFINDVTSVLWLNMVEKVRNFEDFNQGNDPHGEHDFGSFVESGVKYFWKIDYYDLASDYHSSNPADPAVTRRILTLMCADEY